MDNSKEEDFLEVDPPIQGQKFCLLSFVSPENVLKNKDIFVFHKFMENFSKEYNLNESELQEKFKDFLYQRQDELEKEFYEKNDFQTTMRGIKVRGVYDTLKEAQIKAKRLQQNDKSFSVFVGQVGYWLPWDPSNSDNIESQEYSEKQLNDLVKGYKENQDKKTQHFQENIEYVKEQNQKQLDKKKELTVVNEQTESENAEAEAAADAAMKSLLEEEDAEKLLKESKNDVNNVVDPNKDEDPWLNKKEKDE